MISVLLPVITTANYPPATTAVISMDISGWYRLVELIELACSLQDTHDIRYIAFWDDTPRWFDSGSALDDLDYEPWKIIHSPRRLFEVKGSDHTLTISPSNAWWGAYKNKVLIEASLTRQEIQEILQKAGA